jgi:ribosomal protein L7/L12
MPFILLKRSSLLLIAVFAAQILFAQASLKLKYPNSTVYAGIEVGSKGVKMSLVEIGKNAQANGAFNILKDTSANTDFISFNEATFQATLSELCSLYETAKQVYNIPAAKIFTAISSGVKMQAEKENKTEKIYQLIDSFKTRIHDPKKEVVVIDVMQEALLSHLGIVPESRRYNTFLIDIGSGNTKGGFFPYGNTKNFYLFQLNWGTKSTANAVEKRLENDNSLANYQRQLTRILAGAENTEIIYAVNVSGAYPLSDYVAFSGGIAWATATLLHPEMVDNAVVSVTFEEVVSFYEKLYSNFAAFSESNLARQVNDPNDKAAVMKAAKTVHGVFDQRSLMAGAGLMMKIMRQFSSIYETKQFYLVKNGQVGWISAYVDKTISKNE